MKLRHKLQDIFLALDSSSQGKISAGNANVEVLSAELLQAFRPLFQELQQYQECLDEDEFVESALRLYKVSIKFPDRNIDS